MKKIRKAQENELNKKQKELALLRLKIASTEQLGKNKAEQVKQYSNELEDMRCKMSAMTLEKNNDENSLITHKELCSSMEQELYKLKQQV